jgi:hypothetical protein
MPQKARMIGSRRCRRHRARKSEWIMVRSESEVFMYNEGGIQKFICAKKEVNDTLEMYTCTLINSRV